MSAECSAENIPPGYKQTEVGVIPKDWEAKSMDEIGQVIRGASPRPKGDKRFYGGNIPRLMVEDITRDKHWVKPSIDYLTDEGAKQSRLCKKGTLTVICSGTPSAVGLPALLAVDACIHDGILGLVQIEKETSAEFLFHQLSSLQQRLHAAATHGGTFVNLTTEALRAFKIALPPTKTEQEAISKALSDTDAFIESLEQLVVKKRQIKQGAMQELLTGKKRLPGFSGEWKINLVNSIGEIHGRVGWKGYTKKDLVSSGPYAIGAKHIDDSNRLDLSDPTYLSFDKYIESPEIMVQKDDILIVQRGTIGKLVLIDQEIGDATINPSMVILRLHNVCHKFVFYFLASRSGQKQITSDTSSTGVPMITQKQIENFQIRLPLTEEEQNAIATILSDMDAEIATLEEKLAKARQLKQGMMQELLTGRVRLL